MTISVTLSRKSMFLLVALCAVGVSAHAAISIEQIFDAPYPVTPYKKVLDVSMHIAGDLDALKDAELAQYDRSLLQDAIAGRITRLWVATEALVSTLKQGNPVLTEDIEYLAKVLSNTTRTYNTTMADEDFSVATALLQRVRGAVEKLLE